MALKIWGKRGLNVMKDDFIDGTVSLPSITFLTDPDTGFYSVGANQIGVTLGGVLAFTFGAVMVSPNAFSYTLTPSVTANSQTINAVPSATTLTAANTKSFTGTVGHLVLPAITPAANGGGITLTGLNLAQGAISNVADSEAITVKQLIITGAAGAALETGVYTWTGIDLTIPAQAANAAVNAAIGLKITGGATAGAATAYERGIDVTMSAATDTAIKVAVGYTILAGGFQETLTANVTANSQTLNAAPTATILTAANTKSFTGTAGHIVLPGIGIAADGAGISLVGLNFAQGGLSGVADSEAITVKMITMTGAAGIAGETGVYTWTGADITIPDQAANGAVNAATGIKITGGQLAGGASAYQRGIDITMAAATDTALRVGLGVAMFSNAATPPAPDTTVHIWSGTAGAVASVHTVGLTIEHSSHVGVNILSPANVTGQINFGSPTSNIRGRLVYDHSVDALQITVAGSQQLAWTSGVFAFQIATIISTAATTLTLAPATSVRIKTTSDTGVAFANTAEGGTGSMNIKTVRQVVTLSGAQTSTTINIPSGAMLLGASFNVDTAVVTSGATNTWDADFTGGSTTNLVAAGAAGAQNTKANKLIVPEVASAQTNIEFDAPGVETFSSGAIEVVAYYIDQTSLANA